MSAFRSDRDDIAGNPDPPREHRAGLHDRPVAIPIIISRKNIFDDQGCA